MRQTRLDCRCNVVLDLRPWWPIEGMPELGLTMVVEEIDGRLSYWALSHPGEVADFHDRRSFLICLWIVEAFDDDFSPPPTDFSSPACDAPGLGL